MNRQRRVMEMTVDLGELRIFTHFEKDRSYAIVLDRWAGRSTRLTIPQLCEELDRIASGGRVFPWDPPKSI